MPPVLLSFGDIIAGFLLGLQQINKNPIIDKRKREDINGEVDKYDFYHGVRFTLTYLKDNHVSNYYSEQDCTSFDYIGEETLESLLNSLDKI